jgi:hypothetical protein
MEASQLTESNLVGLMGHATAAEAQMPWEYMMTDIRIVTPVRPTNHLARDLRSRKYRLKKRPSKKRYSRAKLGRLKLED